MSDEAAPDPDADQQTKRLNWSVIIGALMVGVVLICVGKWFEVQGMSFAAEVVASIGVAALLVIPLTAIERGFLREVSRQVNTVRENAHQEVVQVQSQVETVKESVSQVSDKLSEVSRRTEEVLAARLDEKDARLRAEARDIVENPSWKTVWTALMKAEQAGAIQRAKSEQGTWAGVHLAFPSEYTATVALVEDAAKDGKLLKVEIATAARRHRFLWPPGETETNAEAFFSDVNEKLRRKYGREPAPKVLPDDLLGALQKAVEGARVCREEVAESGDWALIGMVGQWAICTDGLERFEFGEPNEKGIVPVERTVWVAGREELDQDRPPLSVVDAGNGNLDEAWPQVREWLQSGDEVVARWLAQGDT